MISNRFPWLEDRTPADLTARYVELRDAKKKYEDTHKEKVRDSFSDEMEEIETRLLAFLQSSGGDSHRTPSGTAYRYTASSVTLADSREFQRHVIGAEAWGLLEWRANKTAIQEMVDNGHTLPPGVNYTQIIKLGVRRPEK
jgi:hypothetical protein